MMRFVLVLCLSKASVRLSDGAVQQSCVHFSMSDIKQIYLCMLVARGKNLSLKSAALISISALQLIKASVPLSEMFQYVSTLRGMTKGRAQYSMSLEKYDTVPNSIQTKIVGEHTTKLQEA